MALDVCSRGGSPTGEWDLQDLCRVRFTNPVGIAIMPCPPLTSYGVSNSHMCAVNVRPASADSRNTLRPGERDL